jgi:hypothetical protein
MKEVILHIDENQGGGWAEQGHGLDLSDHPKPYPSPQRIMRSFIVGTAGHIDHGKSTLVKALTGTDPDRLKD